jgi:hypothetical protein
MAIGRTIAPRRRGRHPAPRGGGAAGKGGEAALFFVKKYFVRLRTRKSKGKPQSGKRLFFEKKKQKTFSA